MNDDYPQNEVTHSCFNFYLFGFLKRALMIEETNRLKGDAYGKNENNYNS